jgi:hypothetical protein
MGHFTLEVAGTVSALTVGYALHRSCKALEENKDDTVALELQDTVMSFYLELPTDSRLRKFIDEVLANPEATYGELQQAAPRLTPGILMPYRRVDA